MKEDRCPLCRRGVVLEWRCGWYCSRTCSYRSNPCIFEVGDSDSPEDYQKQLAPLKRQWAILQAARKHKKRSIARK